MFQRILAATDFSQGAEAAWRLAGELAATYRAELLLLHVFMEMPRYRFVELADLQRIYEEQRQWIQRTLEERAKEAAGRGITVRTLIQTGEPAETIAETARAEQADVVVIGAHGERGLTRLLVGNVAERVVKLSPCPVLLAK
ncbi:MAG: universal stress protein [Candidatus Rokuibacteriota bacterium]